MLLAAISIAGLLSMHGLDPAVATVDQVHSTHAAGTDTGINHDAIGLCVFVAAVATIGLASIRRLQHSTRTAYSFLRRRPLIRTGPPAPSGQPLLYRLCVLRP